MWDLEREDICKYATLFSFWRGCFPRLESMTNGMQLQSYFRTNRWLPFKHMIVIRQFWLLKLTLIIFFQIVIRVVKQRLSRNGVHLLAFESCNAKHQLVYKLISCIQVDLKVFSVGELHVTDVCKQAIMENMTFGIALQSAHYWLRLAWYLFCRIFWVWNAQHGEVFAIIYLVLNSNDVPVIVLMVFNSNSFESCAKFPVEIKSEKWEICCESDQGFGSKYHLIVPYKQKNLPIILSCFHV
jgi:hypothetical protein